MVLVTGVLATPGVLVTMVWSQTGMVLQGAFCGLASLVNSCWEGCGKGSMDCLYLFIKRNLQTGGNSKRHNIYCLTFIQSYTHSHTDDAVRRARERPAHQQQLGRGVLRGDTSTQS